MRHTPYHRLLRISALTLAIMLVFDSGLFSPITRQLSLNTQQYLANVIGIQASVKPTELNTLTAEITKKEQELSQREKAVEAREIAVNLNTQTSTDSSPFSTFILSILLFILLLLIVTNYILDYLRMMDRRPLHTHEKTS